MTWLRQLVAGLSPRRARAESQANQLRFAVHKVALGQVYHIALKLYKHASISAPLVPDIQMVALQKAVSFETPTGSYRKVPSLLAFKVSACN